MTTHYIVCEYDEGRWAIFHPCPAGDTLHRALGRGAWIALSECDSEGEATALVDEVRAQGVCLSCEDAEGC